MSKKEQEAVTARDWLVWILARTVGRLIVKDGFSIEIEHPHQRQARLSNKRDSK